MTLYLGVDFHPHQQTVCWCDPKSGERHTKTLFPQTPERQQCYQAMPPAIIGLEASSHVVWFEALLADTGHELRIGNPTLIRAKATSRHKSDKREAELLFALLRTDECPTLWRRPAASPQVPDMLKLRLSFVTQRTQRYNRLQALAHSFGLAKAARQTVAMQTALKECAVNEAHALHRDPLFSARDQLNKQLVSPLFARASRASGGAPRSRFEKFRQAPRQKEAEKRRENGGGA